MAKHRATTLKAKRLRRNWAKAAIKNLNNEMKDLDNLHKAAVKYRDKWQNGSILSLNTVGFVVSLSTLINFIPTLKIGVSKTLSKQKRLLK